MANGDELPPLEIPWQLASTTQLLTSGEPNDTTISLFTFRPDPGIVADQFPGQSVVFLKVTASISPAAFPPGNSPIAASVLGEGIPCYHVLLDMRVRKGRGALDTMRPYFHAAAPMRREMLLTGVVGAEVFEGESEGHFIGKSNSQMHEASQSRSVTSSAGLGLGPFSASTTTTDVGSARRVTQISDTTTREASQERRELVSHMTKVENVLSLLNTKYVGTPYLSFSLSPRPLQQLSVDPSDPSLWFGQLLHRRSSGIEGVQEFTAVVVVPKGEDFCVTARLRRVCLLDSPPGPPDFNEPFVISFSHLGRLLDYLSDTYPPGTPLAEIDDVEFALPGEPSQFPQPVIEGWVIRHQGVIHASVIAPSPHRIFPGPMVGLRRAEVPYKAMLAVWLEMLRAEYERDITRSPLERGVLVGETRHLDTCFAFRPDAVLTVTGSSSAVSPIMPIRPEDMDFGDLQTAGFSARKTPKARALETVTHWNALERRLATLLGNRRNLPQRPGGLKDLRIIDVLLDRWAKLRPNDPRNLDFESAMDALKLRARQRNSLKAAGVTDLKSLARTLKAVPTIERYNDEIGRAPADPQTDRDAAAMRKPIKLPVSSKDADEIRKVMSDNLLGGAEPVR
jgi:hypothetical protein